MVKPKLLLDENVTPFAAEFLRGEGYDAKSVLEFRQGASDTSILEEAVREEQILVTLDKDFIILIV